MNDREQLIARSGSGGDATVDLYQKEPKIHPRSVDGYFSRLRMRVRWVLLGLFVIGPWLVWDGRQAILFDLPARQFHVFGVTFFPQDFFLVAGLLILGAYALFTFTNWLGRVWCGYACPQSVWFSLFIWLEERFEGPRHRRIRLDEAPWDARKVRIKAGKWTVWLLVALATAVTAVGYFVPIRALVVDVATVDVAGWALFWLGFFTTATFVMGAVLREQVCKYMCPYARFQSAMFDPDTFVVSYDPARGEPRGSRPRKADRFELGMGDCIDCEMCVQVCPVGIDIREGLQYECISCALCVDACNSVMDRMNYPRGLIRYTTEHELQGETTRMLRPRLIGYAAVLVLIAGVLLTATLTRVPLELDVIRDRQALYTEVSTAEGTLFQNSYTLTVVNKTQRERALELAVTGLDGARLVGTTSALLAPGEVRTLPVAVQLPRTSGAVADGRAAGTPMPTDIRFQLRDAGDGEVLLTEESRFLAPRAPGGTP